MANEHDWDPYQGFGFRISLPNYAVAGGIASWLGRVPSGIDRPPWLRRLRYWLIGRGDPPVGRWVLVTLSEPGWRLRMWSRQVLPVAVFLLLFGLALHDERFTLLYVAVLAALSFVMLGPMGGSQRSRELRRLSRAAKKYGRARTSQTRTAP